jgi:hypothetical protein
MLADKIEARRLEIPKILRGNAEAAAKVLTEEIHRTLSVQGSRSNPAAPGSPPHRVSGDLLAASRAIARDGAVVVLTSKVGIYQDKGTRRMLARPWVKPAVDAAWARMKPLFSRLKSR